MQSPCLLHIFSPSVHVSPFDVNMAYESGYDGVIPYSNVTLEDIHTLTQDTIFSRSMAGLRRTSIFIGGRDFDLAIDMLVAAKAAMVPPFNVSVGADPSGAITTAAAMIACIEVQLKNNTGESLEGKNIQIIGGLGPVGTCAGIIAASCGANVFLLSHRGAEVAEESAAIQNEKFNLSLRGGGFSTDTSCSMLQDVNILINAAKAGIRVVSKSQLEQAKKLLVAADANAIPPAGIECVDVHDMGKQLDCTYNKAIGIGALAIGDVKYKVHRHLLEMMKNTEQSVYLNHEDAFKVARQYVTQ